MNHQKALMELHFDVELKDLAWTAGYPIASIKFMGNLNGLPFSFVGVGGI